MKEQAPVLVNGDAGKITGCSTLMQFYRAEASTRYHLFSQENEKLTNRGWNHDSAARKLEEKHMVVDNDSEKAKDGGRKVRQGCKWELANNVTMTMHVLSFIRKMNNERPGSHFDAVHIADRILSIILNVLWRLMRIRAEIRCFVFTYPSVVLKDDCVFESIGL